jgi:hypothetical protein
MTDSRLSEPNADGKKKKKKYGFNVISEGHRRRLLHQDNALGNGVESYRLRRSTRKSAVGLALERVHGSFVAKSAPQDDKAFVGAGN